MRQRHRERQTDTEREREREGGGGREQFSAQTPTRVKLGRLAVSEIEGHYLLCSHFSDVVPQSNSHTPHPHRHPPTHTHTPTHSIFNSPRARSVTEPTFVFVLPAAEGLFTDRLARMGTKDQGSKVQPASRSKRST